MQRILLAERCTCVARSGSSSGARRGVLTVLVGAIAIAGVALWALAARDTTDAAGAGTASSRSSTSTSTSSTTGTAVATTPTGRFQVEREIDGLRVAPLGTLYRPKYFRGGIAIHGAGEIPAQPASHGCVRLTNAAMDLLWSSGVTPLGSPVLVY